MNDQYTNECVGTSLFPWEFSDVNQSVAYRRPNCVGSFSRQSSFCSTRTELLGEQDVCKCVLRLFFLFTRTLWRLSCSPRGIHDHVLGVKWGAYYQYWSREKKVWSQCDPVDPFIHGLKSNQWSFDQCIIEAVYCALATKQNKTLADGDNRGSVFPAICLSVQHHRTTLINWTMFRLFLREDSPRPADEFIRSCVGVTKYTNSFATNVFAIRSRCHVCIVFLALSSSNFAVPAKLRPTPTRLLVQTLQITLLIETRVHCEHPRPSDLWLDTGNNAWALYVLVSFYPHTVGLGGIRRSLNFSARAKAVVVIFVQNVYTTQ